LGENAMLARGLLDAAGCLALALGQRIARSGRVRRALLLPLLERAPDSSPPVASAAAAALAALVSAAGYATLGDLAAADADYLVDALCRQLRDLDAHPTAPALLAALLRSSGVAPALLPAMAEPVRAALQVRGNWQLCCHALSSCRAWIPTRRRRHVAGAAGCAAAVLKRGGGAAAGHGRARSRAAGV
jgi:hypothetical protein